MFEFKNGDFVFLCEKEKISHLNLSKDYNYLGEILKCGVVVNNRIILKDGDYIEVDVFDMSETKRIGGHYLDVVCVMRDVLCGFNGVFNCLSQYIRYDEDSAQDWPFTVVYKNPKLPKKMTLKQIEEALGYNIVLDED